MHTSPLMQPGVGNAGGMNVYIDELARTMVGRGVAVDEARLDRFGPAGDRRWMVVDMLRTLPA